MKPFVFLLSMREKHFGVSAILSNIVSLCVCLSGHVLQRARTHTHTPTSVWITLREWGQGKNDCMIRHPQTAPSCQATNTILHPDFFRKKKIQKKQNAITRNPGKKGSKTEDDLRLRPDKRVAERWQVTNPTSALSSQRGPDWNSKYSGQPYIPRISVSELKVTIFYRDFAGLYEYFMHLFLPHKPVRSIKI